MKRIFSSVLFACLMVALVMGRADAASLIQSKPGVYYLNGDMNCVALRQEQIYWHCLLLDTVEWDAVEGNPYGMLLIVDPESGEALNRWPATFYNNGIYKGKWSAGGPYFSIAIGDPYCVLQEIASALE